MNLSALIPLTAALLLGVSGAVLADDGDADPRPAPTAAAQAGLGTGLDQVETAGTEAVEPAGCVRQTGTRIKRRDTPCQAGRSYDRDAIDRTGANSVADALQRLDPSVRIHRR
jgi:hypothetical protein